ncbi:MAG: hypothetical protein CMH27_08390 [Micavibrio sp.]|nr:hypothetical protein [Micavibrio sp.]
MPLLTSPIDGSPMKEIERYGIKLDMCTTSGGIWFDKGEVEKLIHFVREEAIKEQADMQYNHSAAANAATDNRSHSKDHQAVYKKRKRENPLSDLLDIFEF